MALQRILKISISFCRGKDPIIWLNVRQTVCFEEGKKGGDFLRKKFAKQLAYAYYYDYIMQGENPQFLAKAEELLLNAHY